MAIKVANNQSLTAITALPAAVSGGAMTLLETQTASSSATISFTSNIDSTYDEYVFKFYNIHPSAESCFAFQADTGTNTSYNQTLTSTFFEAYHDEDDSPAALGYNALDSDLSGADIKAANGASILKTDIVGNYGFSGNGAAGFELDRADYRLGTEEETKIIARSENHHESFVPVPEELLTHITTWSGETPENLIRAPRSHVSHCSQLKTPQYHQSTYHVLSPDEK